MDLANGDKPIDNLVLHCNCYKIENLIEGILGATKTSNFIDGYALGEQLGWGQFGIIRKCIDKKTGEVFACKSINKERLVTANDVHSVKLEIEIMAMLSGHPNIVGLKAVYEDEDYVHLVMELCAGGELFHQIEKQGRFSEFEARVIFRDLMQVVLYCHNKGIVHRDLKPENILLSTKSSQPPIKLADFGLATYIKPGLNLHGTVGSPFYIAPEVLAGGYNQAADLWSAGVILYILLSGMPPFWGKTKSRIFDAVRAADLRFPSEPWDHISGSSKELITGMLCVDPTKRLTAAQVLDHSWMNIFEQTAKEENDYDCVNHRQCEVGCCSFSPSFIDRNLDYSLTDRLPVTGDEQLRNSPALTSRSSFSLADEGTPCSSTDMFSFRSCCESNAPNFSSTIPSMPSFTFFSPCSAAEEETSLLDTKDKISKLGAPHEDSCLGKLFVLPDSSLSIAHGVGDANAEHKATGSEFGVFGTQSRRNRTIGLGELNQLNIIVTETVIRWSSCTDIGGTPSLRSSLVC